MLQKLFLILVAAVVVGLVENFNQTSTRGLEWSDVAAVATIAIPLFVLAGGIYWLAYRKR